jgi:putative membrane protein
MKTAASLSPIPRVRTVALVGAIVLAACAGPGSQHGGAPATSSASSSSASRLSALDGEFVMRAAQSGMAEVEASRMAVTRASSPEVRDFAQTMIRDHTDANEQLMRIASSKGMPVARELNAQHRAQLNALAALQGAQFDRAYVQQMGVQAHQEAVDLFSRQASQGTDPELRDFAQRTLQHLREHLAMAQQVSDATAAR